MKCLHIIPAIVATLLLWSGTTHTARAADGFIYINVSVKFIMSPIDGGRPRLNPADINSRVTDATVQPALEDANRFLAAYQRGYRIRIVELLEIGGIGQDRANTTKTQPGFYSVQNGLRDFPNPDGTLDWLIDALDENARSTAATKTAFKWNDNAVNIFVPSAWAGGGGINPAGGNALGFGLFEGWLFLHELGHYFYLYHTFDDDQVADTLVDPSTASQEAVAQSLYSTSYGNLTAAQRAIVETEYARRARDSIAAANPTLSSGTYSLLSAGEKNLVDDVFFNIMSYYDPPHRNALVIRMTEGQADRFSTTANVERRPGVSGYTRNVSLAGSNLYLGINNGGLLAAMPVRTVAHAASQAAAAPGDDEILLLRPGNYNEQLTIATPCTLRATRQGPVVIGKP